MDILDKIRLLLGEEVTPYKPRRVYHGRKRSVAGKLKGAEKREYKKYLKKRKKLYKRDATLRRKAAIKRKRYKRTSAAKLSKRLYKNRHKKDPK